MISEFRGEYRWLSNFWPAPIQMYEREWDTSEHAFQAAKTLNFAEQEEIRAAAAPGQAKRLGRRVTLRKDWEQIKVEVMLRITQLKYEQHPDLAEKLLDTYPHQLVEGNQWNDTFWGICRGKGQNHLGLILMLVRSKLRWQQEGKR